jgi:hypothetical protein
MKTAVKILSKMFYPLWWAGAILCFILLVFPLWVIATREERKMMKERDLEY